MKFLILAISLVLLTACTAKPGSEGWCDAKKEQPKSEWTGDDTKTYAKHCLFESQTIGSEKWCEDMKKKDKGDRTTSEIADYAQHCVI